MSSGRAYCVYLLECRDGSYYCGITTDIQQRLRQHNEGIASRYTRGRTPVSVRACTPYLFSKSLALQLERRVKQCPRHKKDEAMAGISRKSGL